MKPQQLMATGQWRRSGEWPGYAGEGPRYQHASGAVRIQGYATHRNSKRRSYGITKQRVWWVQVIDLTRNNGGPNLRFTRFADAADVAAKYVERLAAAQ
jgi:hypothetical protein